MFINFYVSKAIAAKPVPISLGKSQKKVLKDGQRNVQLTL